MTDTSTRPGELAGNITIITGGSTGIGQAVAYLLADRGGTAVVCGRSRERIDAVNREAQHRKLSIFGQVADVTREHDVGELIDWTLSCGASHATNS